MDITEDRIWAFLMADKTIKLLESQLLPYGSKFGGKDWIFQQDGEPIHGA